MQRVNYKGQEKKTVMKKSITKQTERGEKVQNNECTKVVYRVVYNTKKLFIYHICKKLCKLKAPPYEEGIVWITQHSVAHVKITQLPRVNQEVN